MQTKPLQIVSKDEFWAVEAGFVRAHRTRAGNLSLDQQAENYDDFYDVLIRHLQAVGSQCSDGFGEGDFSTSRYVDPSDVTVVVSDMETVFRSGAPDAALAAITETGVQHMVIFDAVEGYIAVLPDGAVIGYSNSEDLTVYQREQNT